MSAYDKDEPWILTHQGIRFTPYAAKPHMVNVYDIAYALSRIGRYLTHNPGPVYSVAQHSVLVSYLCASEDAKWGLLHDAAEAYIGDSPRPVKVRQPAFSELEDTLLEVIAERYRLTLPIPASVKRADGAVLLIEARDLFGVDAVTAWGAPAYDLPDYCPPIVPWDELTARKMFHRRFTELFDGR